MDRYVEAPVDCPFSARAGRARTGYCRDHLSTQATGQGSLRIDPMSPTRFFNDAINAEIEFEKDGTALMLYQNGAALRFKRE